MPFCIALPSSAQHFAWLANFQFQTCTHKPQAPNSKPKHQSWQKRNHKIAKKLNLYIEKFRRKSHKNHENHQKMKKCKIRNKSKQIISKSNQKSKSKANSIKMQRKSLKIKKSRFFQIWTLNQKNSLFFARAAPLSFSESSSGCWKKCPFWPCISFSFFSLFFFSFLFFLSLLFYWNWNS